MKLVPLHFFFFAFFDSFTVGILLLLLLPSFELEKFCYAIEWMAFFLIWFRFQFHWFWISANVEAVSDWLKIVIAERKKKMWIFLFLFIVCRASMSWGLFGVAKTDEFIMRFGTEIYVSEIWSTQRTSMAYGRVQRFAQFQFLLVFGVHSDANTTILC